MTAFIDVLIDGVGPMDGTFVEVEDDAGKSICAGIWIEPTSADRFWRLRITPEVFNPLTDTLRKGGVPKLSVDPLKFEIGKMYLDRQGNKWTVLGFDGPLSTPVRARCEEPGGPQTRLFQSDGHYSPMRDERWDLIKEKGEPEQPAPRVRDSETLDDGV